MGIDVNRVIMYVFLIGPALGGAAGMMVGLYYGQINFTMGWVYGLKAFTAAILGGIGNIPGAMLGGLLLGVIEAMGATYISLAWKDAISFMVLILILIFRPTGSWANAWRIKYETGNHHQLPRRGGVLLVPRTG
jgi:branched-chain amino acid transport system permease protein